MNKSKVHSQSQITTETLPDKCNNAPLSSCYNIVSSEIIAANRDLTAYCRAVVKYIKCLEDATCDCKLGINVVALTGSTSFNYQLSAYNCSSVLNETLNVGPGFNCPGGVGPGDPEVEGLLVLSLETYSKYHECEMETVVSLENSCPGIKPCYKTFSDAAGIALYKKSLGSFCRFSTHEGFLTRIPVAQGALVYCPIQMTRRFFHVSPLLLASPGAIRRFYLGLCRD
ncbi:hypothetical protein LOTGIDRAFT_239542 [Lottia gigantea]|uniref:Uncharacterized protein n=1 Tax=Lottia gigantea TaxID=225164 RepID=V4BY73_LOTGI|nr:hypothetical protein LOTGIDRAFT_239542 [Lottia gigantea]ESO94064.1 hypothetical protein LOTGIDRAFT_239542 [Lottia gigantea]